MYISERKPSFVCSVCSPVAFDLVGLGGVDLGNIVIMLVLFILYIIAIRCRRYIRKLRK